MSGRSSKIKDDCRQWVILQRGRKLNAENAIYQTLAINYLYNQFSGRARLTTLAVNVESTDVGSRLLVFALRCGMLAGMPFRICLRDPEHADSLEHQVATFGADVPRV